MEKNEKNINSNQIAKNEFNILQVEQGQFNASLDTNIKMASNDAFGRLRVSDPYTLFDSQQRYRDNEKFSTSLTGTGSTAVHMPNESVVNLTVGIGASAEVIRETKRVFPYQPGKSLLVMNSFAMEAPKANLRQRIGYFSVQNGVFFEQDGLNKYIVLRSFTSGSVQERRVNQTQWNGHKFDGTDFYQRNLDPSKGNIFWIDVEWLGVGDVRCGFVIDGVTITAHTFHNDNINPTTYMTTATLPIRCEITNTAATGSSSTMKQICSTVLSEGGYQGKSYLNSATTSIVNASMVSTGSEGTRTPLISIRLKSTNLDSVILPVKIDLICTNNDLIKYELVLNGTFPGTPAFTSYASNSNVETSIGGTTISGGTILQSGFIYQKDNISLGGVDNFNFQLGRTLQGVSDIVTIVATSSGANTKLAAGIGWYELV
jgi:hypothetical protein